MADAEQALAEVSAICDDLGIQAADPITRVRELRSTVAALAMLADGHAQRAASRSWRQVSPSCLPDIGARVLLVPRSHDGRPVNPVEFAIFGRRSVSLNGAEAWTTVAGRFDIDQMSHFLTIHPT